MKKIANLMVTQNDIRDYDQIYQMMDFVKNGGFWTKSVLEAYNPNSALLIHISQFEDGVEYIHDGHHRCVATLLGGRDYLRDDEYEVKQYTYERYMTPKYHMGYYTPFDPRVHVRKPDFFKFKKNCIWVHEHAPESLDEWLKDKVDIYRENRYINTVEELSKLVSSKVITGERYERR